MLKIIPKYKETGWDLSSALEEHEFDSLDTLMRGLSYSLKEEYKLTGEIPETLSIEEYGEVVMQIEFGNGILANICTSH